MKKSTYLMLLATIVLNISCGSDTQISTATISGKEYCYRGEVSGGKRNGYGVLTMGDSVVYSGMWKDGMRSGYGTVTDSIGRTVTAIWQADTIVSGTRKDNNGIYKGSFDKKLNAHGHGTLATSDGTLYSGEWDNDRRAGFGCGISANGKVKVGDWRNDKYRGERMLHTSNRIYGIDISRHQHEKGRKKYGIDWSQLRIVSLGSNGKQKSSGSVNYRISFVYIKSTEGTTIRNKYFRSDYQQARKHGIACGAYHFFSAKSSAAAQARFFLKHSLLKSGDMPPVLDLEPTEAQIKQMGGIGGMFSRVRIWLRTVEQAAGVRPVLYVGQSFVNRYLPQAPDIRNAYPIWIARYGEYRPDIRLAFWQLTPYGKVKGIRGEVDINVFNGYNERFREFLQKETVR